MCTTRWVERHNSVNTFKEIFDSVISSLEEIKEWADRTTSVDASVLLGSLNMNFVICLLILNKEMSLTKRLSIFLQEVRLDLKKAMDYASSVVSTIDKHLEEAETLFHEIYLQSSRRS